ncbi:bifunctional hydroxymethylpyrimidine kinase/phosphomethylpyrimidine kinase [Marinobacterium jannaschii]|uniref:bifunctional hydroxymethylpyrimidine kinase/phosphomethylpyrimidine kinase n=1 Tax=Marinobacterium jannaschii TaxID=64970 RepID=UPI00055DA7A4|nr:bifunctional hydroxymethylpyrimidine kinase/phosphomethylpyrimidine kinase [Marinobacterium jannaschii]
MTASNVPMALTIAGSDSGGGAGIQADLKAFSALGVYGASVITALTAQNTLGVQAIHPVPADFIEQQLCSVFSDLSPRVVKTGMLGDAAVVRTVAGFLRGQQNLKLVVDPVMIAKSGNALLRADAVAVLTRELLPLATVITPNLPEAAAVLGCAEPVDLDGMKQMAAKLLRLGSQSVLLKGGHLTGGQCPDVFMDREGIHVMDQVRLDTRNTHGTGCTLASAIAAFLAKGETPADAVLQAKKYITEAIRTADQLDIGHGQGPVHHFHASWQFASDPTVKQ